MATVLTIPIKELTDRIKELDKIIMECEYRALGDKNKLAYDAKRRSDSAIMETLVLKDLIKKYTCPKKNKTTGVVFDNP